VVALLSLGACGEWRLTFSDDLDSFNAERQLVRGRPSSGTLLHAQAQRSIARRSAA
jgi:hypothetical protein